MPREGNNSKFYVSHLKNLKLFWLSSLHEMSKPPGPIILPSTLLGNLSQTRGVLQENICSAEKEETVSIPPSHHTSYTTTSYLDLSPLTTGAFQWVSLYNCSQWSVLCTEHCTVQLNFVQWNENQCLGLALGRLDHDWGGWKSLVLGFVKR